MYQPQKTTSKIIRWRDKRVGIDKDNVSELDLLKTFLQVKALNAPFEVKRTRHGFHFRIYIKHDLEQNFTIRMHLGDDASRIAMDYIRLLQGEILSIDTLFMWKMEEGKVTKEEDSEVLALPFYSKLPAKKICRKRSQEKP